MATKKAVEVIPGQLWIRMDWTCEVITIGARKRVYVKIIVGPLTGAGLSYTRRMFLADWTLYKDVKPEHHA